jgi:phenylacetate-CoA ligase
MVYRQFYMRSRVRRTERVFARIRSFKPQDADVYLAAALANARATIPYYRDCMAGIPPGEERARLADLPVLTKALIRENARRIIPEGVRRRDLFWNSTGGSTGQPLVFAASDEHRDWARATELFYYREMLGFDPDSIPSVLLWSSHADCARTARSRTKQFALWLTDTVLLNCFILDEQQLAAYIDLLNTRKPLLVKGYAGSLYQLAQYARRRNLRIHPPRWIVSTAELLRDHMREPVEDVFRCRVNDLYACREMGPLAGECTHGRKHVFSFHVGMEIADSNGAPLPEGVDGNVLITSLHNGAMPLIRYDLGDRAALAGATCPCGSRLPTLQVMTGRMSDHFVRRDGTLIHGQLFTHAFFFRTWVKRFQVVQPEIDLIEVFIVADGEPPAAELADLEAKMRQGMGEECRIVFRLVDEIPRSPHGKHLFTRSLVAR